jgi:endonuclease/exonuclease/phosphatase family metal-dependent hydrolase
MQGATRGAKLVRRHMKEGNPANGLDYEPIQTLLDAGLEDVYPEHEEGKLPWTYPTRLREDQEDDPRLRIDYVLVNGACRAQMACASHVLTGGVLDTLSDHFPVIVDLLPK